MKKKGFTLIEVIVSIVLVSVVMVSLLGSLIQLRQTYTVIHENSDIIVYSSSISRVINNDLTMNNGIRYASCDSDGQRCDIILGNDEKRELRIVKKTTCYKQDGTVTNCETVSGNHQDIIKTTLKYTNNTIPEDPKLVYIRTLEARKYEKNGSQGGSGYNFSDMSTTWYEYDNGSPTPTEQIVDQYTTILIKLNNETNEDISKHDIILYTAGRYNYSNLLRKEFTLELNTAGAEYAGTTRIAEIFGVGFFETENNKIVGNQISANNKIELPKKGTKAFLGYFYRPGGSDQEFQVIDSSGMVVISSRFFRNDVESNLDDNPDKAIIYAKWADCKEGYKTVNGACVPQEYEVSLYDGSTLKEKYNVSYMSLVKNTAELFKQGYAFKGYYSSSGQQYHDSKGKGTFVYNLNSNSRADARWEECPNEGAEHVQTWENNNNCVISSCKTGYTKKTVNGKTICEGNTYTATFNKNGATSLASTTASCQVSNDAGTCTVSGPTITRSGFTIDGYNTSASATSGLPSLTISANTTFYAITHKDITVNFYKNGNGGSDVTRTCTIRNTATNCGITSPAITAPSGFSVIGFSGAATTHTSSWAQSTSKNVTDSGNYYAQTSKTGTTITATFYKNGNTSQTKNGGSASTANYITDSCVTATGYNGAAIGTSCSITSPSITAPSGFNTIGYSKSATDHANSWTPGTSKSFSSNDTYYAQSSKNGDAITITFNANNNTLSKTSDSCNYVLYNGATSGSCSITSPTITAPDNHTVIGFSTAASDHSSAWDQNTSKSVSSSATYYAQSSRASDTYTVTLVAGNGSSYSGGNRTCSTGITYNGDTHRCSITLPSFNANSGYTKVGWSNSSTSFSGNHYQNTSYYYTGNAKYYAYSTRSKICTQDNQSTYVYNGVRYSCGGTLEIWNYDDNACQEYCTDLGYYVVGSGCSPNQLRYCTP